MNPGALPQVRHGESVLWRTRVELRAFGAKHVQETLRLLVANTHVDIPRTRLIYSPL